jgi:hypothetical protein
VWRANSAICGRAFRFLEDLATVADAIHLATAVFLGFLFHRFGCPGGTPELAAKVMHEIHPRLVGQRETFPNRSQAVGDGAAFVAAPGAARPMLDIRRRISASRRGSAVIICQSKSFGSAGVPSSFLRFGKTFHHRRATCSSDQLATMSGRLRATKWIRLLNIVNPSTSRANWPARNSSRD